MTISEIAIHDETTSEPERQRFDIEAFLDDLDLSELEALESVTGQPMGVILSEFQTNRFSAKTLTGLVWLMLKRDHPDATIDDARKIKLSQIADEDEDDDGDLPKVD
jgi:hypothetical protein